MYRLCLLAGALFGYAAAAMAMTYVVHPDGSGDYPNIQAAISAASDGDTIELTEGGFTGSGNGGIDFEGKSITLRSQSGDPERTWLDGLACGLLMAFQNQEGSGTAIVDIKIQTGWGSKGAVYCGPGSAPRFANCVFRDNISEETAGAVLCEASSPAFTDCLFDWNWSFFDGGAIHSSNGSAVTISHCVFTSNHAGYEGYGGAGGAICSDAGCELTVSDSEFYGNWASGTGAIWADRLTILNSLIEGNHAVGFGGIGGVEVYWADVSGCVLVGNGTAEEGMCGSLRCRETLVMSYSTLYHNYSILGHASGLVCDPGTSATIENCTIAFGNDVPAVECDGANMTVRCCDIYGNEGGDWTGPIADQLGQNGNISLDPLFCSLSSCPPDLHLQTTSPCRPFPPENPECDLMGALPVACEGSPTLETTWGGVKALFRR